MINITNQQLCMCMDLNLWPPEHQHILAPSHSSNVTQYDLQHLLIGGRAQRPLDICDDTLFSITPLQPPYTVAQSKSKGVLWFALQSSH